MGIKDFFKQSWEENQEGYRRIADEKREKEIEAVISERFQEQRNVLEAFESSIAKRETAVAKKEYQLTRRKMALDEYVKARGKELASLQKEIQEQKDSAMADIKKYQDALYRAESMIMDWLKRVDKKEIAVFDEIQAICETYNKYNQTPPADGFEFEEYFGNLLTMNGFTGVNVTQRSQDFGADVLAEKDGIKYVFQCKYYTHPVGVAAVQQVFASKIHYSAHVAVVATNSVFTKSAKVLAQESGVVLWDCEKIAELEKKGPYA